LSCNNKKIVHIEKQDESCFVVNKYAWLIWAMIESQTLEE
jgi:hypothetical protein